MERGSIPSSNCVVGVSMACGAKKQDIFSFLFIDGLIMFVMDCKLEKSLPRAFVFPTSYEFPSRSVAYITDDVLVI